ncbi:hypothetical protein [Mesorhizobium sp. CN2-181]|uniref:hypothetical protein n=1 Tax=Mesorhizobium yinganensis TaxID=3157707 RepID=UPI0032B8475B
MNRNQWKVRSRDFERSASVLLANNQYSVAYHISGLAVECAIKAKIATLFRKNDVPEKQLVDDFYRNGHVLTALIRLSGLQAALAAEEAASVGFRENWATVQEWNVHSRYLTWTQLEATSMMNAVARRGTGVLPWIRRHW